MKGKEALEYVSRGDLRALVNLLQSLSNISKKISADTVYVNSGMVDIGKIIEGLKAAISGNYLKSKETFSSLIESGVNMKELISQIFNVLTAQRDVLDDKARGYAIEKLAEIDYKIVEGATPFIQFQAFLAFLSALKG